MPAKKNLHPVHPGELVAEELDELDLSVAIAAKGIGVTRQALYNLIAGRSGMTPEMAYRLEKALGGSTAETWLARQLNYDLARVLARAKEIKVFPLRPNARAARVPV
jgi:antitoxin HigA-1